MNRDASNASRWISNAWFWSLLTTSYFYLFLKRSVLYIIIIIYTKSHFVFTVATVLTQVSRLPLLAPEVGDQLQG
jgi:hypothetical protein